MFVGGVRLGGLGGVLVVCVYVGVGDVVLCQCVRVSGPETLFTGRHRLRATFDRCELRGVVLRVVVHGVVLVVCLCV